MTNKAYRARRALNNYRKILIRQYSKQVTEGLKALRYPSFKISDFATITPIDGDNYEKTG